ncbi:hypothetical protein LB505_004595 [Fusarium chuoi]|nr:hypothetical protein LB505_004595 [Fusarium chuoi]
MYSGNALTDNFLDDVGISQNWFNVGQQLLNAGIVLLEGSGVYISSLAERTRIVLGHESPPWVSFPRFCPHVLLSSWIFNDYHDLFRQGSTDNLSIVFSNLDLSLAVSIHSAFVTRILNSVAALAFSF